MAGLISSGAYKWNKKIVLKLATTVKVIIKQYLAQFSIVIRQRGLMTGWFFLFPGRWAYNWEGL